VAANRADWRMSNYCVLVKGPCRGKNCDFWARIRIDQQTIKSIIQEATRNIKACKKSELGSKRAAMDEFWSQLGVKDMERLCREEPDLCKKIQRVENVVLST